MNQAQVEAHRLSLYPSVNENVGKLGRGPGQLEIVASTMAGAKSGGDGHRARTDDEIVNLKRSSNDIRVKTVAPAWRNRYAPG